MDEILILFGLSLLALVCEFIDSALGGGYGTILVPILLLLGYDNVTVVITVLITEFFTGAISAMFHHKAGNANFGIEYSSGVQKKKMILSDDLKTSLILGGFGVFGGSLAAIIMISIPKLIVKTYIGSLVIIVGILVVKNFKWKFSWNKIAGIGLIAAFNKGLSGGGYGPLISSGQIIVDRNPKQAIASTSFAEATVCLSALITYGFTSGLDINWGFTVALLCGAIASVPFAVLTVKKINIQKYQPIIGWICILLGLFTLFKTWFL